MNRTPPPPVAPKKEEPATDGWLTTIVNGLNREDRIDAFVSLLGSRKARDRFITVALHAIQTNNSIRNCDPLSVMLAVRESAELNLEPIGALGEAWLIPYQRTCKLSIGYRGYLKLTRNSGQVDAVDCQVVYMNDEFDLQFGTDPRIVHKPLLFGEQEDGKQIHDRGDLRGAYAWARLKTGELVIEWMPWVEIERVRAASPSVQQGRRSPWDDWYEEMARKSVIRRLIKRLPLTHTAERAVVVDSEADDAAASLQMEATVSQTARSAALAALEERFAIAPPEPVVEPAKELPQPEDPETQDLLNRLT